MSPGGEQGGCGALLWEGVSVGAAAPHAGTGVAAFCPCAAPWGTPQSRLVPSKDWGLRLAMGSHIGPLSVALGSRSFLCIPQLGRSRAKRWMKAGMEVLVPVGYAGTPHPAVGAAPVLTMCPLVFPWAPGWHWGSACPSQHEGCSSLEAELVARPIPSGPPAYLAWGCLA